MNARYFIEELLARKEIIKKAMIRIWINNNQYCNINKVYVAGEDINDYLKQVDHDAGKHCITYHDGKQDYYELLVAGEIETDKQTYTLSV